MTVEDKVKSKSIDDTETDRYYEKIVNPNNTQSRYDPIPPLPDDYTIGNLPDDYIIGNLPDDYTIGNLPDDCTIPQYNENPHKETREKARNTPFYDIKTLEIPPRKQKPSEKIRMDLDILSKKSDDLETMKIHCIDQLEKYIEHDVADYCCRIDSKYVNIYVDCVFPTLFEKLDRLNREWNIVSEMINNDSKIKIKIRISD